MDLGRQVAVFRASSWPYFRAVAVQTVKLAGGAGLFIAIFRTLLGLPALEEAWNLARCIAIAGVAIGLAGWTVNRILDRRIQIFERGLRSTDFWGRYRELPWALMRSARRKQVGGLPYISVSSGAPKVELWIPTFIADRAVFCATLRSHAGPSHLLTREFLRAAA
jgi:hypothetical protein